MNYENLKNRGFGYLIKSPHPRLFSLQVERCYRQNTRRLGAETRCTKSYAGEAMLLGQGYFFRGKITFGADGDQGTLAGSQRCTQMGQGGRGTPGDPLLVFRSGDDQLAKGHEAVELRQPGAERLFHSRYQHFLQPIKPHRIALGSLAVEQGYVIYANFGGFFEAPFQAFHLLGGGDGQVQSRCALGGGRHGGQQPDRNVALTHIRYFPFIQAAPAIRQLKPVAYLAAEDGEQMAAFFFLQMRKTMFNPGSVEKLHDEG